MITTNKWQNQQIHQHFKNCQNRKTGSKRSWDLPEPILRVHNKNINIEVFCRNYDNARLDIDYSKYNDDDYIEPWTCLACTYYNYSADIKCEICSAKNPNYQSTTNNSNVITLADFIPSTNIPKNNGYNEDDMIQLALQLSLTENANRNNEQGKERMADNDDDIENVHRERIADNKQKAKQWKLREKLIKRLSPTINYFCDTLYKRNYQVIPMINNNHWIKKLLQMIRNDSLELLYILDTERWQEICEEVKNIKHKLTTNDVKHTIEFQRNHPIIKRCDIKILCHGYLRNNDHRIYIPSDVIGLCANFCGIVSRLLPCYNNIEPKKCIDIGKYDQITNQEIRVYDDEADPKGEIIWSRRTRHSAVDTEMFICAKLGGPIYKYTYKERRKMFHFGPIGITDHYYVKLEGKRIMYGNIIPIIKIKCQGPRYCNWSYNYYNSWRNVTWNGWIGKYQEKHQKYVYKYKPVNDCMKLRLIGNRIDDVDDNRILKYCKLRNEKRYVRRKWSAYSKLNNKYPM